MGDRKKVVIGPYFEDSGGIGQHILGIQKYSRHNIHSIPPNAMRKFIDKHGIVRHYYRSILEKVGFGNNDIVHSHVDPWFGRLCEKSRSKGCRWIHTYHTLYFAEDYPDGLNRWQSEINNFHLRNAVKADVKICVSRWCQTLLHELYSIKTIYIPNGVDVELCDQASRRRFEKKYNISNFLLFVGNIGEIKNSLDFINMAIKLPEYNFVMIGRGLEKQVISGTKKINPPKNITFLGELDHSDVLDAIASCKVYVITSKREGLPTSLLEAMAMARPVVAPDQYGCAEAVASKENGFLYRPNSLDDLIGKTISALEPSNIGTHARRRVLEVFDWKVVAKQIDMVYESIK